MILDGVLMQIDTRCLYTIVNSFRMCVQFFLIHSYQLHTEYYELMYMYMYMYMHMHVHVTYRLMCTVQIHRGPTESFMISDCLNY